MFSREVFEILTLILQLGIVMIVSVLACTLGAAWLGRVSGVGWLSVPGFFIGAAAGINGVWRLVRKYIRKNEKRS